MKNKAKVISIIIFLSVLIILVSCGKQEAYWKGTIEEVDGVTVVKNPKEPMYEDNIFNLEEELVIGEDISGEEYEFIALISFDVDDEGNIYALDTVSAQIKVFNKDGEKLRAIGKKGQGPGELMFPAGIEIFPDKIMIFDMGNQRLVFFSYDGQLLRNISTAKHPRIYKISSDRGANFIAYMPSISEPRKFNEINLINSNFDITARVAISKRNMMPPNVIVIFAPILFFQVNGRGNAIWANQNKYELYESNANGSVIRKIIKECKPVELTSADEEMLKNEFFEGRPIPPNFKIEIPKHFLPIRNLIINDENEILVRTFEYGPKKGNVYDYFDADCMEKKEALYFRKE